ncbi:copper chaperone PCu(A)C [Streptomyces sp. V3I7]|uniref:copper chaperone PCu(A)C n=1 Tax=Streptomyces sp. V3I7 TaxID=3042278 RepID=UPI00277F052F|nr:copper chaperone PCu(A)C [Streptomyces sp. V3I7]MDQ0991812.1 copper(I)-binding protein [Streptomyces sp. V3I7]
MRRLVLPAVLLAGTVALTGCDGGGDSAAHVSVGSSYMPQPVSDEMAAGFLTVVNRGGTADQLTSVTSDAASDVTMHSTAGGAMEAKSSFAVPAHGRLVFRSGGNHLMFDGLKRKPKQGDTVTVKLTFARSGTLTVEMPVKSATYRPPTGH